MIASASDPIADIFNQYDDAEERNQKLLTSLFNEYISANEQLIVQKTQMGGTEAYVGSVTLEWLANRVDFASHLPLLRHKYNPATDNIEIDADSIDEIQQRPLDWSRQAPLVQYLASRKHHKFPPVLVVINQPWVDNPRAKGWNKKKCAKKSTTQFTPLGKDGNFGLLNVSEDDVTIYALDGQHRLMGVQGLMKLLKTQKLERYKKDKSPYGSAIAIDDLIEQYQISPAYLRKLPKEKIGIEFISAVATGETREEARSR